MVPLKRKFLTLDANDVRELRENLLKMNKNYGLNYTDFYLLIIIIKFFCFFS